MKRTIVFLLGIGAVLQGATDGFAQRRPYRLPDVDIKQRVIWGSQIQLADGTGLAFGGQDQDSRDGRPHTRILKDGRWVAIPPAHFARHNPLVFHKTLGLTCLSSAEQLTAVVRAAYFQGTLDQRKLNLIASQIEVAQAELARAKNLLQADKKADDEYSQDQLRRAAELLDDALVRFKLTQNQLRLPFAAQSISELAEIAIDLQQAVELLGSEPPARALSPLVYDKKTNLYVLFGGDHLDFLTNDTWVFDPQKQKWQQRHPPTAPSPRANHKLVAVGDGTVQLTGGYTYASNTDYLGGQYIDIEDGRWTYDVAANRWTGTGDAEPPDMRSYRTGPFHPDFYLDTEPPDRDKVSKELASLPANTWVKRSPPRLPRLNRDWGTAVIDPDHDLMLRFSGGHSAHGGSDVLHYHFATNRWELTFPVEFPLGQLYANTRYPQGFNFNRRPWVTGHTYKSYAYDTLTRKMLFVGRQRHTYIYDPLAGDWIDRKLKPKSMTYNSCFYTLTLCATPHGVYCWTKNGDLLRYDNQERQWRPLALTGDTLRGTVVDRAGMSYDSKRHQLICMAKTSYRGTYDGIVFTVQLKSDELKSREAHSGHVTQHKPTGMASMTDVGFLREQIYDPDADLVVIGAQLPADKSGTRRTPAFDPANNRWVSLDLKGADPHGKDGRNVSLGYMFDARRKLHWAVDTNSQVYVLRLDAPSADLQTLK